MSGSSAEELPGGLALEPKEKYQTPKLQIPEVSPALALFWHLVLDPWHLSERGERRPLREAGHEAEHVEEVGLREANDGTIWTQALQKDAIIVTKGEDFAMRSAHATTAPVIVWLRAGNTTNRVLKVWFELRIAGIVRLTEQGHRLIEVI